MSGSARAPDTPAVEVMLVEDHALVREGLRLLLQREDDLDVVAEAESLRDALALDCSPAVIVTDLMLGDAGGPEVVKSLRERFPNARILVLTMVDKPADVQLTISAGADGYLLKDSASDDLVEAIGEVRYGRTYLQPSLGFALARERTMDRSGPLSALTPREQEVLRLLVSGHTNNEAATKLGIAPRTVESHRAKIQEKTGLRTRSELVKFARESGLEDAGIS